MRHIVVCVVLTLWLNVQYIFLLGEEGCDASLLERLELDQMFYDCRWNKTVVLSLACVAYCLFAKLCLFTPVFLISQKFVFRVLLLTHERSPQSNC